MAHFFGYLKGEKGQPKRTEGDYFFKLLMSPEQLLGTMAVGQSLVIYIYILL